MFCEFLPESSLEDEAPQTLLMEQVKPGESYELVVTNASGLFRSDDFNSLKHVFNTFNCNEIFVKALIKDQIELDGANNDMKFINFCSQ